MWKTISFAIFVSTLSITAISTERTPLAQEGGSETCINFVNSEELSSKIWSSGFSIDGFEFHKLGGIDLKVSNNGIQFPDEGMDIFFPYAASSGKFDAAAEADPVRARMVDTTKEISFSVFTIQKHSAVIEYPFSGEAIIGLRFTDGDNEGVVSQLCIIRDVSQ